MTWRRQTVKRTEVVVSGGIGLAGSLMVTVVSISIRTWWFPSVSSLLGAPLIAWSTFFFCLLLALLEIPLMIYGLRKVAESKSSSTPLVIRLGNGIFVLFPVIYALPNLLLTNPALIWLGGVIAASSLLRFVGSVIFLPVQPNN